MADHDSIVITFDEQDGEPEPRFAPGSVISGNVSFTPEAETEVEGVTIAIGWRTEGKGNEDQETVWDHEEEFSRELERPAPEASGARGVTMTRPFRCKLPDSPWSYAGKIVSIVWEVSVQLDVPWAMDINASRRFIMRPVPR